MKIGDRCFVHGYIDEIRKDTVIIRNEGGYFGTDPCEVITVQPEINCSEFPNNSDTISRQDAVSRRRLLSDLKELITAWEKYPNTGGKHESKVK